MSAALQGGERGPTSTVTSSDFWRHLKDTRDGKCPNTGLLSYLERLPLQADDDPHRLGVKLHQLPPLVLPARVNARRSLRTQLQVPGKNLQLEDTETP